MKNLKKLTLNQKKILSKKGYDATKYLFLEEDSSVFTVVNKENTNERISFAKKK